MRWIAGLLLMGMAHAALASGPPTFDKFQSAVESKGAPPEGTFFNTGKFKSLCTCLDHTGDVGVIESSTTTLGTERSCDFSLCPLDLQRHDRGDRDSSPL